MNKNLGWKTILILVLVIVAAWTLYPPQKRLKPGIDLAGGTSLIYEIDTQGLEPGEKKGLSERMITILRRRIDPANIQNLVWRPQGNTRFEIQMPLASAEARLKRQDFEHALTDLLAENINPAVIMRSLTKPPEQRTEDFNDFAKGYSQKLEILENLANIYDQRIVLQTKRDRLAQQLKNSEEKITAARIDLEQVKENLTQWIILDPNQLTEALRQFDPANTALLEDHINIYTQWADTLEKLTDPEIGLNLQYKNAKGALNALSLTEDQINFCLDLPPDSPRRTEAIEKLKTDFFDRADKIDKLVAAHDRYYPYKGRLDDPRDLQRMLKGAGVLEFRILPTIDRTELSLDEIENYVRNLTEKGPKFASDNNYTWCEIENINEWNRSREVIAAFGEKYYVLASNQKDEIMLHTPGQKQWKLEKAAPGREGQTGRRAIDFTLDERGGLLFANVTGKNMERPLCILLDGLAISAPTIRAKIYRRGQITGSFTQTEIGDMVNKLNAGSLPARLIEQPISVKTIGPSIGADNRDKGIKAGFIGLGVIILCMVVYYTFAGLIASLALLMNILFVLAVMALLRATFTLPGIAGIILTIGMSVDANVLIFERIREEQLKGSSLRIAIKNGYQKAFRTIIDANLTTFITAAILLWVASEEIKGFAIVLMLGLISSMFTAIFVTRTNFDLLLSRRIIKDHLLMLRLIRNPNINWMRLRKYLFVLSVVLITGGLSVFFTRDNTKNNKYDIEFTGGTSVQINLKENVQLTRQQVEQKIRRTGSELNNADLAMATVYSIGKTGSQYEINTTETNKTSTKIILPADALLSSEQIHSAIENTGAPLADLSVTADPQNPAAVTVTTSQTNRTLVKNALTQALPDAQVSEPVVDEIVNRAILTAFGDQLEIQQDLKPQITSAEKITEDFIDTYPELSDFLGGVKITVQLQKATTAEDLDARFASLRFKPDTQNLNWYTYKLYNTDLTAMEPNQPLRSFVYVSVEPEASFRELTETQWERFVETESAKIIAAGQLETSLPRVTQISPSIGAEAKTSALIAIVLSLSAIVTYIWIRFGNVRYGIAAIIALVHDVCITLGIVTACTYIADKPFGQAILICDFKINLAMIAAFLTIIGYSLNDTIVVFDRIRENRRKKQITAGIINDSINQTLSRTLLTSFTTFIVVLIMYIFGGVGLRGFTFAIGLGVIVGTYSSIAIAAPILLFAQKSKQKE